MRLEQDAEIGALCVDQYRGASSMTDCIAALGLIADSELPQREDCLAEFARRWQGEALVMDKWFAVQAMSARADTLVNVRRLMDHPAFSLRNPNKVYALLSSFAGGNPVRFHAADGSGYGFLADQVLAIDPLNPSVASRLARSFARWRAYDEGRQAHMRAQLQRILAAPDLSRDVYEIAAKSLAG
jgi:aminopeptidase N